MQRQRRNERTLEKKERATEKKERIMPPLLSMSLAVLFLDMLGHFNSNAGIALSFSLIAIFLVVVGSIYLVFRTRLIATRIVIYGVSLVLAVSVAWVWTYI